MNVFLAILGSLVAAAGTVPYIAATTKGQTKPRVVTWLTFCLLTGLAAAASFADGQLASGLFALLGAIATGLVVIVGLKFGDRSFETLDIACLIGVVIGLVLWQLFNSPTIGVWAAIIIDFVGLIPTLRHAWKAPQEETTITYALVFVGGILSVAAALLIGSWSVTAIGYPLYSALSLGSVVLIIFWRKRSLAVAVVTDKLT
jgi:hypothetical protein